MKDALITSINKDIFTVSVDNKSYDCKVRGKLKNDLFVGDNVTIDINNLTIEKLLPRKNFLNRPSVANIDYALIVTSLKKPDLDLVLLDKLLSIIIIHKIKPIIILTKKDLLNKDEIKEYKRIFKYYQKIGIKVFYNNEIFKIKRYLKNSLVTVCGQTGAGKSTFINKLDKSLKLQTNEISKSLGRGVHTTRLTSLYKIKNFYIIDTPGFSSIDINNYDKYEIRDSFIEFKNNCKYKDCMHIKEVGCLVKDDKSILKSRYNNYLSFINKK